MPLIDITNSQTVGPLNRKRSHDQFAKQDGDEDKCVPAPTALDKFVKVTGDKENCTPSTAVEPSALCFQEKPSPGMTPSGSSPLEGNSPSPNATPNSPKTEGITTTAAPAPSKLLTTAGTLTSSSSSGPPAKKTKTTKTTKITPEEKAAKEAERARKKLEKEEAERQKAAEKARKQAEKEEAEKKKAAEKAKKQAEKLEKEEAAKKKAAEKAEKLAQADKDKASQRKIFDMFAKKGDPSTPKKASPATNLLKPDSDKTATSPLRTEVTALSQYLQHFKPFYVKDQVTLADQSFGIDDETREVKADIILEFLEGKRELEPTPLKANALEILQLPFRRRRGRVYPSVRKLMTSYQGDASLPIDLTSDSQTAQICHTREALQAVPLKSLKFREDVRPPYIGTISGLPAGAKSLRSIALHPTSKAVPSLNYDYDSEAEWQEEDGEDVEDIDDEEDDEEDEEMDDFLDDSEDVGPARMVFSGAMEPENTGLCWENRKRLSSPAKMYKFRMEFILESLPHHSEIDPFSSSYWNEPSKPNPKAPSPAASSSPSVSTAAGNGMAPPGPSDAFSAISVPKKKSAGATKKQLQPLPGEYHQKLKALLIEKPSMSKIGLIEWFAGENPSLVKNQVRVSFELLTEKSDSRPGRSNAWKLRKDA